MKKNFTLLTIALLTLSVTGSLHAQPELDPTFSNDGLVLTKISASSTDIARTVMVQPDGKIVVGGNSFNSSGLSDAAIVRIKSNGKYDLNFGTAGISTIQGGFFCDMDFLPNGKIIVAGSGVSPSNFNNYIVYRLNPNGSIDNSFGNNGSVAVSINGVNMICFDVVVQDGKIILGGYIDNGGGGQHKLLVIRLNKNGTLDNTFATGGIFTLDTGNKDSECRQLSIQPDGKIIAGGSLDTIIDFSSFRFDFLAVRLKKNGTLDPNFGTGGIFRGDKSTRDICYATGILSDGRIILGGVSDFPGNNEFTAVCLKPNGNPDNSFGNGGWKFIDFYGGTSTCNALAVEGDDDIVMAGNVNLSTVGLAKVQSNGQLDPTFGDGGIDTSIAATSFLGCNDVALDAANKIIITGYRYLGSFSSYLTARYTNSQLKLETEQLPADLLAVNVYPNPITDYAFNVQYNLDANSMVTLELYDVSGKLLQRWDEGNQQIGSYTLNLTLPEIQPGSYFMRLTTENDARICKVIKVE
jgi:uncharacterized delta-60 repeat protein